MEHSNLKVFSQATSDKKVTVAPKIAVLKKPVKDT